MVIDLVGRGHDPAALIAAARVAFAADNPGVAISPVGRFGTMEISLPRRVRPLGELLCRDDGALSDRTLAERLLRAVMREAEADPGARLRALCAPAVAQAAEPLAPRLAARIGARFTLVAEAGRQRSRFDVVRS